jgi:predicted MFS family arabinose efflux permease
MRVVFWVAVIPAGLAVACVLFGVEEQGEKKTRAGAAPPIRLKDLAQFSRPFWIVVMIGVVFTLARFSEAFLVLKASAEGLPLVFAPLVLVVMNIIYAAGAYPVGALSDRAPPGGLLLSGLAALIAADLAFAMLPGLTGAFLGIALWGLHMALSQGLLAKLIADHAPAHLRGSAFGVFNLATGLSLLFASVTAGLVWEQVGSVATFLVGAGLAGLASVLVIATQKLIANPQR